MLLGIMGRFRTLRSYFTVIFLYVPKELISRREGRFILIIDILNLSIDKLHVIYTFIVITIPINALILIRNRIFLRKVVISGLIFYYIVLVSTPGSIVLFVKVLTSKATIFVFGSVIRLLGLLSRLLEAVLVITVRVSRIIARISLPVSRAI